MNHGSAAVLDQLLDPVGRCLTPEVAALIARLRADPEVQGRIDALADRRTGGQLSPDEEIEYEAYVQAIGFISILQAKARKILAAEAST